MLKRIIKLLLVIFFMSIIFMFSNERAVKSTKRSDGVISFVHKFININKSITKAEIVVVRKSAHFFLFFCLGLSYISLLSEYTNKNLILYSLLFVFIYACFDEVHQLFVGGRSFQVFDIFIDTCGGLLSFYIYNLLRRRKYEQEKAIS